MSDNKDRQGVALSDEEVRDALQEAGFAVGGGTSPDVWIPAMEVDELDGLNKVRKLVAILSRASSSRAEPFGWASPKQGNYFTRSKTIADRIGGLVAVYTESSSRAEVEIPEPVAWIEKGQLEAVRDESSDAWVYWRESGHIAEPDEVALYTRPQSVPRALADEQIESAIEGSGGAWHEDEFRICGKDLMAMCRALAAAEAPTKD